MDKVLELNNISKSYPQADGKLIVLNSLFIEIKKKEIVALLGPSGSGKSTLLHIAGLLDKADSGEVIINGKKCSHLSDYDRTMIRRKKIGFIYQFHHLMPELTALENVILPQRIAGVSLKTARKKAQELLFKLSLSDRINHKPSQLSGGQQQRVAIARAMANDPEIILADEPTGNLDIKVTEEIIQELIELSHENNVSILVATHNIDFAKKADRTIQLV